MAVIAVCQRGDVGCRRLRLQAADWTTDPITGATNQKSHGQCRLVKRRVAANAAPGAGN